MTGSSSRRATFDTVALSVREGLSRTPKRLPPWLLYDSAGSELFERITQLPEYYPTRTERAILEAHGDALLGQALPGAEGTLVELGAGTATKTQVLLRQRVARHGFARYVPLDVSPTALDMARARLGRELPDVEVLPRTATNEAVAPVLRSIPGRKLVLFIGSSIGNYEGGEALALLRSIRQGLQRGDGLLLGTDFKKDPQVLVPAYADAEGVTAAFNLNVLERINRELGGRFVSERFEHIAVWNESASRIEMHLESKIDQCVAIEQLGLRLQFLRGERIHTESSVKYDEAGLDALLVPARFLRERTVTDRKRWFGVSLGRAV